MGFSGEEEELKRVGLESGGDRRLDLSSMNLGSSVLGCLSVKLLETPVVLTIGL